MKDKTQFKEFEKRLIRKRKADFYKNLAIVHELHREALNMGVFGREPLDGIEADLRIAGVINLVRKTS